MFTVLQTQEFQRWLDGLRDRRAQVRIAARLRLAEAGNLGTWVIGDPLAARSARCGSTSVLVIVCILLGAGAS